MSEFLVWHQGPDDIHPCRTWLEAVELANIKNAEYQRWAKAHTDEFGAVTVRSWAIPYTVAAYRDETGHQIELPSEGEPSE
ncbi:hypothetical protein ACFSWE_16545 [Leucobacter albus]|uniref:Uncharacterized protein n=1 Tax=Leucobacter albus TaxID=272210 RepID=A0ABW3TTE1_9MICO